MKKFIKKTFEIIGVILLSVAILVGMLWMMTESHVRYIDRATEWHQRD